MMRNDDDDDDDDVNRWKIDEIYVSDAIYSFLINDEACIDIDDDDEDEAMSDASCVFPHPFMPSMMMNACWWWVIDEWISVRSCAMNESMPMIEDVMREIHDDSDSDSDGSDADESVFIIWEKATLGSLAR
jgi:hypothetical protein